MVRLIRMLAALAASCLVLSLGVVSVAAQDATPEGSPAGGAALPEGCSVVATDLINPRFIAFGEDGTLYITEAGNGGDEEISGIEEPAQLDATPATEDEGAAEEDADDEGAAEGEEGPPPTRGFSGQVSAVSPDGEQSVIAEGLPSYSEGVGPAGIVVVDGQVWITTGGAAVALGIEPLENEDSVLVIDPATGETTQLVELWSYEQENNPDGTDVNPNLYGLDIGADGQLYVADAGGNTVYRVDPATGEFALLGIVPSPSLPEGEAPAEDATPAAGEEEAGPPQPVPTGLHVGSDGNVYVVTLGAFIPGAAEVQIAQADGSFVLAAGGLSVGVGVTLGPDGALYVSQLASFTSETEPPGPGSVVRIGADGTAEPVVEVPYPHGITFDADGNLYVVANSTALGPPTGPGQVWRCDGIAAA